MARGEITNPFLDAPISGIESKLDHPTYGLANIKTEIEAVEAKLDDPAHGLAEIKNEVAGITPGASAAEVWAYATRTLTAINAAIISGAFPYSNPAAPVDLSNLRVALQSDPLNVIRDAILSDATRFPGANIDALISSRLSSADFDARLSATRAGYIDYLADATYGLSALNTDLDTLLARLTATRAGYLDNLTRLDTTLSTFRATEFGRIDAAISSRASPADVLTQVQKEVGVFSGQTNLKTLLAALGIPDVAGKPLYTCLITDRLDHATYGLSALNTDLDTLLTRLTATRAGYLDYLNTDAKYIFSTAYGTPADGSFIDVLLVDRLTATRAGYLDRLDATVSSRLASADFDARLSATRAGYIDYLANATYGLSALNTDLDTLLARLTDARAAKLDNLDATVSSRASATDYTAARAAKLDNLDALISSRATAADVWAYATRTLTTTKFPFWSAIITQTQGTVSIAAGTWTYLNVQPPAGETWLVEFAYYLTLVSASSEKTVNYSDFDGTTRREHVLHNEYSDRCTTWLVMQRILTNSLYASLGFYAAGATTGNYGYSGFKLSEPLWSPKRVHNPEAKPWKREKTKPLPAAIKALDKYAWDILGIDPDKPNDYDLGIMLEEDTVLAVDPATNFPVERLTAVVKADVLADFIAKFKAGTADPVATGYSKYLKRWKTEGIDFGIPGV
jgi:hypothetical protein